MNNGGERSTSRPDQLARYKGGRRVQLVETSDGQATPVVGTGGRVKVSVREK